MLILNPDIINSCRVCRSPNQDGDYQCLYQTSSRKHEDDVELSEAGALYEKLLDISLSAWHNYPQFLCNSCDLQMKLFEKLKDKALKTLEYLQNINDEQIFKIEPLGSACQNNEEVISEPEECQELAVEYPAKEFEEFQEMESNGYQENFNEQFNNNSNGNNGNTIYNYKNADEEYELKESTLNSCGQEHVEPTCLYNEQELNSMGAHIESNYNEADTQTEVDEKIPLESLNSEGEFQKIILDPVIDKNDYVTEIYELIDDESKMPETNLENDETIKDYDLNSEVDAEANSPYNDIEYLMEEHIVDPQNEANNRSIQSTNAFKRKRSILRTSRKREYRCIPCDLEFPNSQEYKLHRSECHNEKYFCNVCSKELRSMAALHNHMKIHSDEPAHRCEICQKTFNQKAHYQYHMKNHNNIRNFECNICEKAFISNSDLKTHKRLHTGERPYVCNICGKDYLMMEHLKTHLITHTDQSFPCDICNKNFTTHKTLRLHVRTIHEDTPKFKCSVCLKPFRRKHHLEYHLKFHHKNVNVLDSGFEIIDDPDNMEDPDIQNSVDDPGFIAIDDDVL